jgi:hypothetical protein
VNAAHTSHCASCGGDAIVAPIELEVPKVKAEPQHFTQESHLWLQLFPELPIAAFLVLIAPFWAIVLVRSGHASFAALLVIGSSAAGYAAYRAIRKNQKWVFLCCIFGMLALGWFVAFNT